jgi:hypothetical protein
VTLYQIWPATSGPGAATVDGGVCLATEFYVTDPGLSAVAVRFWRADTSIVGPVAARIYTVVDASSGTPLAGSDVTFPLSGVGWQTAVLAAPVALTANQRYRVVCQFPTNYSATSHYWDSGGGAGGVVNGPLVAPAVGAATGGDQGSFAVSGSLTFPSSSFNAAAYWVDVSVQSGSAVAVGLAVEQDSATTVTVTKRRAVGQVTTVDTAHPVTIPGAVTTPGGYPDIERVVCDLLADLGGTGTRTPADLQAVTPFLRVRRVGGVDDRVTDRARVDVEVFATTREAGEDLAEQVRQRLSVRGPLVVTSEGRPVVVDRSMLLAGPVEVPWPDVVVRMFHASYQLESRRPWP